MGDEDRRLLLARLGRDLVTLAFDVGGGFVQGTVEPRDLGGLVGRVAGRDRQCRHVEALGGAAREARRCREARRTPSSRSSSVTGQWQVQRGRRASGPPTSSSKFRDASASTAAIASAACGPVAATSSSCPRGGAQGGDRVQALRVGRSPPVGEVAHLHQRVEGGRRLHEPRRRPGVQPVRVRDGDPWSRRPLPRGGRLAATHVGGRGPEVGDLAGEPAAGFSGHRIERGAHLRRDRGRHRAFDQRGLAQ